MTTKNRRRDAVAVVGKAMLDSTDRPIAFSIDQSSIPVMTAPTPPFAIGPALLVLERVATAPIPIAERWFYQECIPSFQDPGEFRIFIVTTNDSSALRRRRGHIIDSILAHFADNGDIVPVALAGPHWEKTQRIYPELRLADSEQFTVYIFDALRNREDATEKFESLDVGVRLDIAISPRRTFFVNEITRTWDGDAWS